MSALVINSLSAAGDILIAVGTSGEKLRLERSRTLDAFSTRCFNSDLTELSGEISGSKDTIYHPSIKLNTGEFKCDCRDHQNLLDGTRKAGKQTGENWSNSPCKHVLHLARQGYIALLGWKKSIQIAEKVLSSLTISEDCESDGDDIPKKPSLSPTNFRRYEKELNYGPVRDLDFDE